MNLSYRLGTMILTTGLLAASLLPASARAQDAMVNYKSLSPEAAVEVAQTALKSCRDAGYQVAVAIVDRGGNLQALIRDRFAGPHTTDTSYRKAWTSVSFKTDTLSLSKLSESGEAWAIRGVTNALPLGGGLMIQDGEGSPLGGVGVSGAPSGSLDAGCAQVGLDAIADKLAF
jgi:uncharacterized protein GlcG (DUF336 family)